MTTFDKILCTHPEMVQVLAKDEQSKTQLSLCWWRDKHGENLRFVASFDEGYDNPTGTQWSRDFATLEQAANYYDALKEREQ